MTDSKKMRAGEGSKGVMPAGELTRAWQAYGAGDFAGALGTLASLAEHRQADVEVAYLKALASGRAGDAASARQSFQLVLRGVEQMEDVTRRSMLRRLARGHLNRLDHGTWDLEPETWERA